MSFDFDKSTVNYVSAEIVRASNNHWAPNNETERLCDIPAKAKKAQVECAFHHFVV